MKVKTVVYEKPKNELLDDIELLKFKYDFPARIGEYIGFNDYLLVVDVRWLVVDKMKNKFRKLIFVKRGK